MMTLNTNSVAAKAAIDLSKNTFNLQKSLQSFDVAEITQANGLSGLALNLLV